MNYSTLSETDLWVEKPSDRQYLVENGLPKEHQIRGFEYWKHYCDGESLPDMSKIDPLLMPTMALPWVELVEVQQAPRRFRMRLWGTGIVAATGYDYSGMWMDEKGMNSGIGRLNIVVEQRRPYFAILPMSWHSEEYRQSSHYSVIGLPFRDQADNIARILCLLGFG